MSSRGDVYGNPARCGWGHDPESRGRRARRIVSILEAYGVSRENAMALDVGCSAGLMTRALAPSFAYIVGVDPDEAAIAKARDARDMETAASFVIARGERLPFATASFEVVVCNHVYEHVDDAPQLMSEILRVLVPGGVCYFAAGHTLQIIEPHYRLPLLSWLPRPLAHKYLRLSGRGSKYTEQFLAPWSLRRLVAKFSRCEMVSAQMLREPERFSLTEGLLRYRVVRNLARIAPAVAATLAPTYIWLLWK